MRLPWRLKHAAALALAVLLASALGALTGAVAALVRGAPGLDELRFDARMTTFVLDRKGRVIRRLFVEHRIPISIDQIPRVLQEAVIAAEDANFEKHRGFDVLAILRAAWVDLRAGSVVQGGSTITQQLAKNLFLTHERTLARKLKEVVWAVQLERHYSKEEILEAYLNQIYFGEGAYGVEAAAQTYFGKHARDLTLPEAALLAGLIRNPTGYNPYRYPERARARRNHVLDRMAEVGFISSRRAQEAKQQPLGVVARVRSREQARYYVDYVVQQLVERYGREMVYTGGLRVYTTLDLEMQRVAEQVVQRALQRLVMKTDEQGISQPQVALVALDPHNGDILAMVGGRGEPNDFYNRAVLAARQPGSAIKPFVWAAAMDAGWTPASILVDQPREYVLPSGAVWSPENYDRQFKGPMTLREALEQSRNLVAVQLLERVGPATVIRYARQMGISTLVDRGDPNDVNLALALGGLTRGVRPLEMAAAYAVFASGGIYSRPRALVRVEDSQGRVLDRFAPQQRVVLSEVTAYLVTDMLRGVIESPLGTGRRARIVGRPAAGKTGTTQNQTDVWFVGYTPDLVAAVWIGNDDPEPLQWGGNVLTSGFAAQLWGEFVQQALQRVPPSDFPQPQGVVRLPVDVRTGLRVDSGCGLPPGEVREEVFRAGTEPHELSPRCRAQQPQSAGAAPSPAPAPGSPGPAPGTAPVGAPPGPPPPPQPQPQPNVPSETPQPPPAAPEPAAGSQPTPGQPAPPPGPPAAAPPGQPPPPAG